MDAGTSPDIDSHFPPTLVLVFLAIMFVVGIVAAIIQAMGDYHGTPRTLRWGMHLTIAAGIAGLLLTFVWVFDKPTSLAYWLTFAAWGIAAVFAYAEGYHRGYVRRAFHVATRLSTLFDERVKPETLDQTIETLANTGKESSAISARLGRLVKAIRPKVKLDKATKLSAVEKAIEVLESERNDVVLLTAALCEVLDKNEIMPKEAEQAVREWREAQANKAFLRELEATRKEENAAKKLAAVEQARATAESLASSYHAEVQRLGKRLTDKEVESVENKS
jgi:hypothetical protein